MLAIRLHEIYQNFISHDHLSSIGWDKSLSVETLNHTHKNCIVLLLKVSVVIHLFACGCISRRVHLLSCMKKCFASNCGGKIS